MKKQNITEQELKQTPSGGALVGKREGQTIVHENGTMGGYLVGRLHKNNGIKAINKSTGQPLEMQGGEVVITAPAVSDQTKRNFEGKMLTNREILSKINEYGGGVSFEQGGDIPNEMCYTGASYNFGGKTMTDYEIMQHISNCGCDDDYMNGGGLAKNLTLKDIAKKHKVTLKHIDKQVELGLKAESEHTNDVSMQMDIVKDHLFENPNYYTILNKVGLEGGGTFDANPFLNYYFEDLKDFLKYQNGIDLQDDFTFRYKGETFYIHPIILVGKQNNEIKKAEFIILDLDDEEIGQIDFYPNSNKKFIAVSDFFNWNDLKFINGGQTKKENLVKDAKKGNTPARDLNNYNDLLDVNADGKVGGENGLAFDDGGDISKPVVLFITIKETKYDVINIIGETASTLNEFYKILRKYTDNNIVQDDWVSFYVNNGERGNFLINFDRAKKRNTNKSLNPDTFQEKDVRRVIENLSIINNFYWTNFFNNIPPTIVDPSYLLDKDNLKFSKIWIGDDEKLADIVIKKLEEKGFTIKNKYNYSGKKIAIEIFENEFSIGELDKNKFDNYKGAKEIFPSNLGIDVTTMGVAPTTLKIDDLTQRKIWIGDNPKLSEEIQKKAFELSWEWSSGKEIKNTDKKALFFSPNKLIAIDSFSDTKLKFDELNKNFIEILPSDLGIDVTTMGVAPTTTGSAKTLNKDDFKNKKIWIGDDVKLKDKVIQKFEEIGLVEDKEYGSRLFNKNVFIKTYKGDDFVVWSEDKDSFDTSPHNGTFEEILPSDLGIDVKTMGVAPTTLKIDDLTDRKIWIGDNPKLSEEIQKKAFELGWEWKSGKEIKHTDKKSLFFDVNKFIAFSSFNDTKSEFNNNTKDEIFPSDLGIDVKNFAVESTSRADLTKLSFLVPLGVDKELKDLNNFLKLLPSFQESKFSNEKSLILKEIKKLNDKLNNKFISDNELFEQTASNPTNGLFTPQGLLQYYFSQTTQSPIEKLEPPCELPTPNGQKSKLPLNAYLNVRTLQFKKWFGDWEKAYETNNYVNCSKLIDEETKEPKIFYHGVRKFIPNFGQFSNMGQGVTRPYGSFEPPSSFPASYFSDDEDYAKFYGGIAPNMPKPSADYEPFIYSVFLSSKNPLTLIPLGFDVSYKDVLDYLLVAYGIKKEPSRNVLNIINNDINKKHPIWVYLRNDVTLIETIKEYGYDSIIQIGDIPTFDTDGNVIEDRSQSIKEDEFLILNPTQIKSASVNKSFYFEFFKDIRFNKGGYVRL